MKQFFKFIGIKFFLGCFIFLCNLIILAEVKSYERFLGKYKFKMFLGKKDVGFIHIEISSITNNRYVSRVESYTDIPLLFFTPKTKIVEEEYYNNDFYPIYSNMESESNGKKSYTSTILEGSECSIEKKNKKHKMKKLVLSEKIVITPGNVIPLVTELWNFPREQELKFKYIDKDKLSIEELKLRYIGTTNDGNYKIVATIGSNMTKFNIFLDKYKRIIYAEGLGMKIQTEEYVSCETKNKND
ncbi:MAG: hypothetical protein NZ839_00170 [Endomicrobia bacterium]|nr:hypothetical protein [Endomicrobiia bacterium]